MITREDIDNNTQRKRRNGIVERRGMHMMSCITLMLPNRRILLLLLLAYPNDENEYIANVNLFYARHEFLRFEYFVVDHF